MAIWRNDELRGVKLALDQTGETGAEEKGMVTQSSKRPMKHSAAFGSGGESEFATTGNAYTHVDREAYLPARKSRIPGND